MMSCTELSNIEPSNTEANNLITINCSGLKTCKKCAEQGSCLWSLERQTCFADYGTPLLLTVRTETACPCVSAISTVTYATHLPYEYTVKVSNDLTGFMEYLEQTRVSCVMLDITRPAVVFGDVIRCAPMNQSDLGFDQQVLMTYHCYVIFGEGDTILRLDDGTDSYFTVFDEYHQGYRADESCVTCLWDVGQFTYYYMWCSSRNFGTGRYKYYVGYSDTDHKAVMPANDRLLATVPATSGCNDVRIQSVEPLSALWTGGQQIKVTVNNYMILADHVGQVKVTVAGRDCVRPMVVDRITGIVTCLLTTPSHDYVGPQADEQGPVLITYQSSSLTVESAQTFRFVYPEITEFSPSCGPLAGGTLITVRGRYLDAGNLVTIVVTVDEGVPPSVVPCEVIARHSNRILCLTGPSNKPAVGNVSVVFDKALLIQDCKDGPLIFTYTTGPALAAGQQFRGIASGGNAVPLRGSGFACVSDATMYVDRNGVRQVAASHCRPFNDTYMVCDTPKLHGPKAGALPERLNFGFHIRHAYGHVSDMSPPPDIDGYVAHPDPVLENFFVLPSGRSVLINGLDLGHGYSASDVVVAKISKNLTVAACNVTAVTPLHIVCESDSPAGLNLVTVLFVTIGDQLAYTVHRRMDIDQPESFGQLIIMMILISVTLVFCYYKLKSMNIAYFTNTI